MFLRPFCLHSCNNVLPSIRLSLNVIIRPLQIAAAGPEGAVFGICFERVVPPFVEFIGEKLERISVNHGVDRRIEAEMMRAGDRAEKIVVSHDIFGRVAVISVDKIGQMLFIVKLAHIGVPHEKRSQVRPQVVELAVLEITVRFREYSLYAVISEI